MTAAAAAHDGWRRHLRRDIAWLLAFKLAALMVLRILFFSADDRPPADAEALAARLAVGAATAAIDAAPAAGATP